MADDRHYVPGDFYRIDDRTGFKRRASRTKLEWDGLIVDESVWEPRQPQDMVRGVRDDQTVPMPRPRQTNQFVIVGTWVTAFTGRLQSTIQVESTVGFMMGDQVALMLDTGDPFYPYIVGIGATSLNLCPVIPHSVGRGINEGTYFGLENTVVLWSRGTYNTQFILDNPCNDILDFDTLGQ
jgi:hypothetical protein